MIRHHPFIVLGAVGAFLSVALGAFGAHSWKSMLSPELQVTFETAVRYQMYHSLALFMLGILLLKVSHRNLVVAGWLFVWGIFLFFGSLYLLSLTRATWLGAITPMGGHSSSPVGCFSSWGSLKAVLVQPDEGSARPSGILAL